MTIEERIILFDLLPREGDIESLRLIRKLREELSLEDVREQIKFIAVREGSKLIYNWDAEAAEGITKDVKLMDDAAALRIVRRRLRELNGQKKLHDSQVDLYTKLVGTEVD